MNSQFLTLTLLLILSVNCIPTRSDKSYTREQIVALTENEKTITYNKEYLSSLDKTKINFRYRILPYIESKDEKLTIKDFQDTHQILISYDNNLFLSLEANNFKTHNLIDQYHKVDFFLRYNLNNTLNEEYFPTIIFMIQQGKIWPGLTSFIGVGLKIQIRLSVFDKSGEEIAYCQKKMFDSIPSNELFEKYILANHSPFLNNLNELESDNYDSIIKEKINQCKKELELTNKTQ